MTPQQMKSKRTKLGLSQQQLADRVSQTVLKGIMKPIGRTAITEMESGNRTIQPYIVTFFKDHA